MNTIQAKSSTPFIYIPAKLQISCKRRVTERGFQTNWASFENAAYIRTTLHPAGSGAYTNMDLTISHISNQELLTFLHRSVLVFKFEFTSLEFFQGFLQSYNNVWWSWLVPWEFLGVSMDRNRYSFFRSTCNTPELDAFLLQIISSISCRLSTKANSYNIKPLGQFRWPINTGNQELYKLPHHSPHKSSISCRLEIIFPRSFKPVHHNHITVLLL